MGTTLLRCCACACALLLGGFGQAVAEEESVDIDYQKWEAELRAMLDSRDVDVFELDFQPLDFDRILVKDGAEVEEVYHYLTFRLRNRVSDNAQYLLEHASAFNEVMDAITKEYQGVSFSTDEGPTLRVDDADSIEEERLATVVERADLKVRGRSVNITVLAHDENGSRFRLFDEVPGEGPQEAFDFADLGETRYGATYRRVREAIEEHEGRRLLSVHQIRDLELPPYNPQARDDEGVAQGEVFGVIIFNRLPVEGDRFEIMVQGLSNKLRFNGMLVQQGSPDPKDQVQDYFNARILRRTYVMEFARPGDEYFLDQAGFELERHGWEWKPAFNRIARRSTMAYAKYFMDNIELDKPTTDGEGMPVLHDAEVADDALAYYDNAVGQLEQRFEGKLAAIEAERAEVRGYYETWLEEDAIGAEEVSQKLQRRIQTLEAREQELRDQLQTLREGRPDFRSELEEQ